MYITVHDEPIQYIVEILQQVLVQLVCTKLGYTIRKIYTHVHKYVIVYTHISVQCMYTYIYLRADAVYQSQWGHGVGGGPSSQLTRKITFIN